MGRAAPIARPRRDVGVGDFFEGAAEVPGADHRPRSGRRPELACAVSRNHWVSLEILDLDQAGEASGLPFSTT